MINVNLNVCWILILFFLNSSAYGQDSSSFYQGIEKKIRFSEAPAPDYYLISKYNIRKNTIESRRKAAWILEKGILEYPFDTGLLLIYSKLLQKQGFFSKSENYLSRIVELHPDHGEAYYLLGKYYLGKMQKLNDQISSVSSRINYKDYALEYYEKSRKSLQKSIQSGFTADSVYISLYWLYFDAGSFEQALTILEQVNGPDWKIYQLKALAAFKTKLFEESQQNLEYALEMMPQKARQVYRDAEVYFEEDRFPAGLVNSDPLLITAVNERYLSHTCRVIYAQEKFSVPEKGIPGWKTDRGKTLIRYGFPLNVFSIRPEIEGEIIFVPTVIWRYSGFELQFVAEFMDNDYRFAEPGFVGTSKFRTRSVVDYNMMAENIFNSVPEIYQLQTKGGRIPGCVDLLFWKHETTTNKMKLNWKLEQPENLTDWQFGLYRMDNSKITNSWLWETAALPDYWIYRDDLYFQTQLELKSNYADSTRFLFEAYNPVSGQFLTQDLNKPEISFDEFYMSDIAFGYLNSNDPALEKYIPNPGHVYIATQPVLIHFRIYNLPFSGMQSGSMDISYRIIPLKESRLWEKFLKLFNSEEIEENSVTITNEYQIRKADESIFYMLDMKNLPPGEYILQIEISTEQGIKLKKKSVRLVRTP